MNRFSIIGNLVRDPEARTTPNGVNCCTFTVAVNRKFKDASGNHVVDYFDVIAWRQLADICTKYLAKGKKVYVGGELQSRTYEGRDGNKRKVYELNADDVEMLSKVDSQGNTQQSAPSNPKQGFTEVDDEELPF